MLKTSLKIAKLKLQPHLPGTNELIYDPSINTGFAWNPEQSKQIYSAGTYLV